MACLFWSLLKGKVGVKGWWGNQVTKWLHAFNKFLSQIYDAQLRYKWGVFLDGNKVWEGLGSKEIRGQIRWPGEKGTVPQTFSSACRASNPLTCWWLSNVYFPAWLVFDSRSVYSTMLKPTIYNWTIDFTLISVLFHQNIIGNGEALYYVVHHRSCFSPSPSSMQDLILQWRLLVPTLQLLRITGCILHCTRITSFHASLWL